MIIALPQLNFKVGDISGNSEKIISAIRQAQTAKAELIVFPELSVWWGFTPRFTGKRRIHQLNPASHRKNCSCMYRHRSNYR